MSIKLHDIKKTTVRKLGEIVKIKLYKNKKNGMYRFSCTWANNNKRYFDYEKKEDRDEDYTAVFAAQKHEYVDTSSWVESLGVDKF